MAEASKTEHRRQTSAGRDCELGLTNVADKETAEGDPKNDRPVDQAATKHQSAAVKVSATAVAQPVLVAGVVNPNVLSVSKGWNVATVRGKVTDRCLWSVCKAMTLGVFLIATGAGMATLGYYSDRLSTVSVKRGNETVMVKNEKRDSQLNILTYFGPVVMGVGGFIIVAACVMTFEARDTASKIVPVWFRKNRPQVVPSSSACSNTSVPSSRISWERFLVRKNRNQNKSQAAEKRQTSQHKELRNSVNDSLINFGKFLQSSMDSGKLSPVAPSGGNRTMVKSLRKCPSEPDLLRAVVLTKRPSTCRGAEAYNPEAEKLLKPEQSDTNKNLLAPPSMFRGTSPIPHRPSLAGQRLYRQAVSVDCQSEFGSLSSSQQNPSSVENGLQVAAGPDAGGQTKYDSNNSMAMDLYLPQGSFTLKVKDEKRIQAGGTSPAAGGHHGAGVRSSSNASSGSGAKSTPPGSRRHTPQSSFDRNLKSISRDSSRSSGGGYRTPQQSISRNNSGTRSPLTHTPPSLSRNNSGAIAGHSQPVSRANSDTRSSHTPPSLSRNNSGATPDINARLSTRLPHSPNWLQQDAKNFSRFESLSQDESEGPAKRARSDSTGSGSSRTKTMNKRRATEPAEDPDDQDGQSIGSRRHPFVRQRALENKPETES